MVWNLKPHVQSVTTCPEHKSAPRLHIDQKSPRSLGMHQALITLAHEGLPKPWKRPLKDHKTARVRVSQQAGTDAAAMLQEPVSKRP